MGVFLNIAVASAVSLAAVSLAAAQDEPEYEAGIDATIECLEIADPAERLSCLEAATQNLSAIRNTDREDTVALEKQRREETFGLTERQARQEIEPPKQKAEVDLGAEQVAKEEKKQKKKQKEPPVEVTSRIVAVRANHAGKVTLALENGQIWRQPDSDTPRIVLRDPDDRVYTARIKRGGLGSYKLTVAELGRTIRVRRIK